MIFGVELEHGADVDGADDVDVVEEEGLVEILWIFEEEPGGFFQAAAGVEEDFFAGDFNAHAEIFVRFEIVDDLVGEVVDVDDDFGDAEGTETRESDFEEGTASDFDEGFGASVRERAEARAEAGGEDHGFHWRVFRLPSFSSSRWRRTTSRPFLTRRRLANCSARKTERCWPPVQPKETIKFLKPRC